jgi:hypothetical protein
MTLSVSLGLWSQTKTRGNFKSFSAVSSSSEGNWFVASDEFDQIALWQFSKNEIKLEKLIEIKEKSKIISIISIKVRV